MVFGIQSAENGCRQAAGFASVSSQVCVLEGDFLPRVTVFASGRKCTQQTAETFIFDLDEDIYGARIKVELLSFIRPECKFSSVDELQAQVEQDKQTAKTWLSKSGIIFPV